MGFRKTENGNVIYDFDFVPAKLVPLSSEAAHGAYDHYAIVDSNGKRAPVELEFQGERYRNYGFVFASITSGEDRNKFGHDVCICANAMVVATLDSMFEKSKACIEEFDPWDADGFAARGVTFAIMGKDAALDYLDKRNIPLDKFNTLKTQI